MDEQERFWKKVDKKSGEECWEWQGRLDRNGIGQTYIGAMRVKAHKQAFIFASKSEVPERLYVLQTCKNRLCCNPAHLFLSETRRNTGDKTQEERFWDKVDKSGECWLWQAKQKTYGYFDYNRKTTLAHRVSYMMAYGEIPAGLFVCHHCDTPLCVRPDHLFVGTHQDNMDDCASKDRWAKEKPTQRGEGGSKAVLTNEQVLEIRERYVKGVVGVKRLAKEYGVNHSSIYKIVTRKHWKHI